jgi:phenylalanyl-tRNA synthetase alpha chain
LQTRSFYLEKVVGTQNATWMKSKRRSTTKKLSTKVDRIGTMTLEELKKQTKNIITQIKNESDLNQAELKSKYIGKKGVFKDLAKVMGQIDNSEKKDAGKILNELKEELTQIIESSHTNNQEKIKFQDLTAPGIKPKVGHMHPVSQAMEEITQIFERIGFSRARYPEVDWDWYVFEALNMPKSHPARDEWETFFVDAPIDKEKGKVVLTTHTSNGQVHEMERLKSKPPIRMINISRCYRRQQDATHTQMFHQFEGLVVDKGINIQNLKGTLDYFAEQFYGPGTKSRIRPFHFQFTEPSLEVDFSCHICKGTGLLRASGKPLDQAESSDAKNEDEVEPPTKCKFCKSGWHEVGGAGMVHPNVLKAGGIDPEVYTGFAFGWGVERTYTLKQGLNIDDIRLLYSGDLKFLEQF